MKIAISRNNVPIRLTEERWFHIVEHHDEMAGYSNDVLLAIEYLIRSLKDGKMKYLPLER